VDLTTSPNAEVQLHLPLRHGGCGLRVPGVHGIKGQVARLASAALAQRAMSSCPALLRPFDGPHHTALESNWQQAMAAAPGLWSDEVTCLRVALDSNAAASAQSTLAVLQRDPAHLKLRYRWNCSGAHLARFYLQPTKHARTSKKDLHYGVPECVRFV
jgi:hypothetical protein